MHLFDCSLALGALQPSLLVLECVCDLPAVSDMAVQAVQVGEGALTCAIPSDKQSSSEGRVAAQVYELRVRTNDIVCIVFNLELACMSRCRTIDTSSRDSSVFSVFFLLLQAREEVCDHCDWSRKTAPVREVRVERCIRVRRALWVQHTSAGRVVGSTVVDRFFRNGFSTRIQSHF
jgi:hypothetical protein